MNDFFFKQKSGRTIIKMFGDDRHGGVCTVRGTEGIVHLDFAQSGQGFGKRFLRFRLNAFSFFLSMKTKVFQ